MRSILLLAYFMSDAGLVDTPRRRLRPRECKYIRMKFCARGVYLRAVYSSIYGKGNIKKIRFTKLMWLMAHGFDINITNLTGPFYVGSAVPAGTLIFQRAE